MNNKNNLITLKQKEYIQNIEEFSLYPIPHFTGTTKKEASNFINKYKSFMFESNWVITKGYN